MDDRTQPRRTGPQPLPPRHDDITSEDVRWLLSLAERCEALADVFHHSRQHLYESSERLDADEARHLAARLTARLERPLPQQRGGEREAMDAPGTDRHSRRSA